jgi:hypothetical protein
LWRAGGVWRLRPFQRRQVADEDVDRPFAALEAAAGAQQTGGGTIRLTLPRSSSISMKVMPLAVSGRWRAVTMPAISTVEPCSIWFRSQLRTSFGSRPGRSSFIGCLSTVIPVER